MERESLFPADFSQVRFDKAVEKQKQDNIEDEKRWQGHIAFAYLVLDLTEEKLKYYKELEKELENLRLAYKALEILHEVRLEIITKGILMVQQFGYEEEEN